MATVTKTIGTSGDYATPAAAFVDFIAGNIAGASSGDDIVLEIQDIADYTSPISITSNSGGYNSYKLTVAPAARHDGTLDSGARLAISSESEHAILDSVTALTGTVEWLEITRSGGGKVEAAYNISAGFDASHSKKMFNCMLYNNGAPDPTGSRAVAIGNPNSGTGAVSTALNVHNVLIHNWTSGKPSYCAGIVVNGGAPPHSITNVTIDGLDVTAGSGVVYGIRAANGGSTSSTHSVRNCVVTNVGTSGGTSLAFSGIATSGNSAVSNNATDKSAVPGTNSLASITPGNEFSDIAANDFTLAATATLWEAGVDLGTGDLAVDLTGRDRDTEGDTWSIGAYQLRSGVVTESIAITSPVTLHMFQRSGGTADVTVSGTYSSPTATSVEVQVDGGAWAELDSSLSAGTFSGTLTGLAEGEHDIAVRLNDNVAITDSVTDIGIGDIFLVAGQSNASGRLTNLQTYSHASLTARVYDQDDAAWRDLIDPTDPETSNGSIWPLLATLHMADQSVPVGFITTAEGGTSISQWSATTPGLKYTPAVTHVNAVAPNGIAACIWNQGETDANGGTTQATYNSTLDGLIAGLQADTGLTFPMVCDLLGFSNTAAGNDAVRQAQIEAWGDNADIFPGANQIQRDSLHWETDSEGATHAALLWVALDEALYSGPSARGPRLTTAETVTGSSTLTLTFDRDIVQDASFTASIFSVDNDDGAARAVSSVAPISARRAELTLSGALDGTSPTVTMASGNDAVSPGVMPRAESISLPATINSRSTVQVPAEPIYAAAITKTAADTTAPIFDTASVATDGATIVVSLVETESVPILPATGMTGFTVGTDGAAVTVSSAARTTDTTLTLTLSRTIFSNETVTLTYDQGTGNVTDGSSNELTAFTDVSVTNNSTESPSITVTSPLSTDRRLVGTAEAITWTSEGVIGAVDVLVSTNNGGAFSVVAAAESNDGTYSWNPDTVATQAIVRIRSTDDNTVTDDSDAFIVATTSTGGVPTDSPEWNLLRQIATDAGLELTR